MVLFKRFKIKRILKKIKSLQLQRLHNQPSVAAINKEVALYFQLAKIYRSLEGSRKYPFAHEMVLECYRHAAEIENAEAQYLLAKHFLEEATFRQSMKNEGIITTDKSEQRMLQLQEEALFYLQAAVELNHVLAKRMLGLCYIQGSGVSVDQDRGFEYIVASIEQEGSWDKVTQIFASMGLNKPEFYTALMKHRSKV